MQWNVIHINKSSLGSSIIFKNAKEFWGQNVCFTSSLIEGLLVINSQIFHHFVFLCCILGNFFQSIYQWFSLQLFSLMFNQLINFSKLNNYIFPFWNLYWFLFRSSCLFWIVPFRFLISMRSQVISLNISYIIIWYFASDRSETWIY